MARAAQRLACVLDRLDRPCELEFPDGGVRRFGAGAPAFRLRLCSERALHGPITELSLARAYVNGDIDFDTGDEVTAVFALRERLPSGAALRRTFGLVAELALLAPTTANVRAIRGHYSVGNDFFLSFLDQRYHLYSQCLFESSSETLEQAAEHKLERMWEQLGLQPGMR